MRQTNRFKRTTQWLSAFMIGASLLACSESKTTITPTENSDSDDTTRKYFTVALSTTDDQAKVYVQALANVNEGNISFDGVGFEMPSSRTARIFALTTGVYVYNLDYGGGRIYKFRVDGGETYTQLAEKNVEYAMGTANPRWTKANEETALLHYVSVGDSNRTYDATTNEYTGTDPTIRLMSVDLSALTFGEIIEFTPPSTVTRGEYGANYYISRIDAPIIAGDKAYYGLQLGGYNPDDPTARVTVEYKDAETLVVDYPSLENPEVIATKVGGVKGATNGYRTPVSYLDEKGDIYQLVSVSNSADDTFILRLRDGKYDETYSYNLSELLGKQVGSLGWFYVGNGIGYIPYYDFAKGGSNDSVWSVARVDLYNNKVVKLNVPEDLWLRQYQSAVVRDGKLYMGLNAIGKDGYVYIFDINSESPDGFTKGATLEGGAGSFCMGIY